MPRSYQLDQEVLNEISAMTNGDYALGSAKCKAQIAAVMGRRVVPGKLARPRNRRDP